MLKSRFTIDDFRKMYGYVTKYTYTEWYESLNKSIMELVRFWKIYFFLTAKISLPY